MLDDGATHRGNGLNLEDYRIFGTPVRAAADGTVVMVKDDVPDNIAMLKQAGESDTAYLDRLMAAQMALLTQGIAAAQGNYVAIDHGNSEVSIYAHLKRGSVRVKRGDRIAAGTTLAAVGSSGNSTEPHLHFQLCDTAEIAACRAIPPAFRAIRLPLELAPRSVQSGDIVETTE